MNYDCPECDTNPGQLHAWFCLKERCPFCGRQLTTCGCINSILQLRTEECKVVEEYLDDSVEPLSSILARWKSALGAKGRIPHIA